MYNWLASDYVTLQPPGTRLHVLLSSTRLRPVPDYMHYCPVPEYYLVQDCVRYLTICIIVWYQTVSGTWLHVLLSGTTLWPVPGYMYYCLVPDHAYSCLVAYLQTVQFPVTTETPRSVSTREREREGDRRKEHTPGERERETCDIFDKLSQLIQRCTGKIKLSVGRLIYTAIALIYRCTAFVFEQSNQNQVLNITTDLICLLILKLIFFVCFLYLQAGAPETDCWLFWCTINEIISYLNPNHQYLSAEISHLSAWYS